MELLFSNMHPSITIYFNSPIHTLSLHNSFRWFHILHRPTLWAAVRQEQSQVIAAYYQVTISKENNRQPFSVGIDDMLEIHKAFTSNISQLFINACKLQLRDNTYTMTHSFSQSQNQFSSHLKISRKGTPVFDWFGMAALIRVKLQPTLTFSFSQLLISEQICNRDLLPLPKPHAFFIFYSLYGNIIQIYIYI